MKMNYQFLEFIPDQLEDGVLYISLTYATVVHRCCCGCGNEVVTPLSPGDWELTFNGESISLYPSIGNWSLPCRSHYWIRRSEVKWAESWSDEMILKSRTKAADSQDRYTSPKNKWKPWDFFGKKKNR